MSARRRDADLTRNTSAPHPYVAVRWRDHAPHAHDHDRAEDCINFVDPASEQLTACLPLAHPWGPSDTRP